MARMARYDPKHKYGTIRIGNVVKGVGCQWSPSAQR